MISGGDSDGDSEGSGTDKKLADSQRAAERDERDQDNAKEMEDALLARHTGIRIAGGRGAMS